MHLHLIACNSFLIQQVDVFDMAIIKNKIKDIVIMNLTPEKMLGNVRVQLQALNGVEFLDGEWLRFVEQYLDKPSDNSLDKTSSICTKGKPFTKIVTS
jgi:hypothetical protein